MILDIKSLSRCNISSENLLIIEHICELIKIRSSSADQVKEGPWLAGGAVTRLLSGEGFCSGVDFDVFFRNKEDYDILKQRLNAETMKSKKFPNSESMCSKKVSIANKEIIVQLVGFNSYNSIGDLLSSFDINVCRAAICEGCLFSEPGTIESISTKEGRVLKVTNYKSTMRRVIKYSNRGFIFTTNISELFAPFIGDEKKEYDDYVFGKTLQDEIDYEI